MSAQAMAHKAGRRVYLDHNATAPLRPQAREAAVACLEGPGNASSVHTEGRAARAILERARGHVAHLSGAESRCVIFTSSATEALALGLHPEPELDGRLAHCDVLLASAVEHPAVLRGHRFAQMETVAVDLQGRLDLDALEDALQRHAAAGRRAMVAVMAANNETGVIQPVAEVARLGRAHDALILCDAVQAAGRMKLDMSALDVDFLSFSAHKIGGLQGAGALVVARAAHRPLAMLAGGGQERGRRAGTENVPACAAFGAAAETALAGLETEAPRLAALRDRLEREIIDTLPGVRVMGAGAERLANTTLLTFEDVRAETLVIALDLAGISVSSGSACSSGKVGASHVLEAMQVPAEWAGGAIRLSLGWSSCEEDVDLAVEAFSKVLPRVRSRSVRAA